MADEWPLTDIKTLLSNPLLARLSDTALVDIARNSHIEQLDKGSRLYAVKESRCDILLLEGELELYADGRLMQRVRAGSSRAVRPVFVLHTEGYYVLAVSPLKILRVNQDILKRYVDFSVHDINEIILEEVNEELHEDEGNRLLNEIRNRFSSRNIDLPSLPIVANHINEAILDEEIDMERLAEIVGADPVITARLIQVASSPVYQENYPVTTLRDAIDIIGIQATRAIVTSVVQRSLYHTKSDVIRYEMYRLYLYSIEVAAICHVIASHLQGFDPERATLAGLLHRIGVIPILMMAEKRPELIRHFNKQSIRATEDRLHAEIGSFLMQTWGFDEELITTARECDNWQRKNPGAPDYCDIVIVAQLHNQYLGGKHLDAPSLTEVPAFQKLGLGNIDAKLGIEMLNEARHELLRVAKILRQH